MDYDAWAEWYDVFYSTAPVDDVGFYVDLAVRSGGSVLEIGCGTGRVTLPVAAAGVDVVGVDFAPAMLRTARGKAASDPASVGAIKFVEADMRTLALDRRFPLVIIPARTLLLATTPEEQVATLRRAREHLAPGGTLAFNVFVPDPDVLADESQEPFPMGEAVNPATGRLCRLSAVNRADQSTQALHSVQIVDELDGSGEVVRHVELEVDLRYVHPTEVELMLEEAGLIAVHMYGGFHGEPLDEDSEELVVVAKGTGDAALNTGSSPG